MLEPDSDNVTIVNQNQTLYSSPELIFHSCGPICKFWENLHLYKITYYMVQIRLKGESTEPCDKD